MCRDVGARPVQVHVLIDATDPGRRDEMMMFAIRRALPGQLDLRPVEMVDFSHRFMIGRNDVHVFSHLGDV
jgi:hypothetical protein